MINILYFLLLVWIYLLGGASIIAIIRNDIKKCNHTDLINGLCLQKYSDPNKITENRAIQMLWKIKENYPAISIDASIRALKAEGFIA